MQHNHPPLPSSVAKERTNEVLVPAPTATEIFARDAAPVYLSAENEISDLKAEIAGLKSELRDFGYILTGLENDKYILVKSLKGIIASIGLAGCCGDREWNISGPSSEPLDIEDIIEKLRVRHMEDNWDDEAKEVSNSEMLVWDIILNGSQLPSFDYDKFPDALIQIGGITISPPNKSWANTQETTPSSDSSPNQWEAN